MMDRPRKRVDCKGGARPCPYVGCRYNLYLDIKRNGSIKLNFPRLEVWNMPETCALDVADSMAESRGCTLREIAGLMGLTRERVRQMELNILSRLRKGISWSRSA